jgi:hypothetical protein
MAYLELTTKEFANIVKANVSKEIKNIIGLPNGFSFNYNLDHGIPLLPSNSPFIVEYSGFSQGLLTFEININNALFRIFSSKIISLAKKSIENELPVGVSLEKNRITIILDEVIDKESTNLNITDLEIEDSIIKINIQIK